MNIVPSQIRGAGLISPVALLEYKALQVGQPLLLTREPTNAKDPNAIIAKTVHLQPVGYVARQQAAILSNNLDDGELWYAVLTRPGAYAAWAECELVHVNGSASHRRFRECMHTFGASERVVQAALAGLYTNFVEPTT